jgi:hypothetical protein
MSFPGVEGEAVPLYTARMFGVVGTASERSPLPGIHNIKN